MTKRQSNALRNGNGPAGLSCARGAAVLEYGRRVARRQDERDAAITAELQRLTLGGKPDRPELMVDDHDVWAWGQANPGRAVAAIRAAQAERLA